MPRRRKAECPRAGPLWCGASGVLTREQQSLAVSGMTCGVLRPKGQSVGGWVLRVVTERQVLWTLSWVQAFPKHLWKLSGSLGSGLRLS